MIRRPPRSTLTHSFPTRRSSDLQFLRGLGIELRIAAQESQEGREVALEAGLLHHRSEEHTSELQSLMRISYAVFCLKKKITHSTSIITVTDSCHITPSKFVVTHSPTDYSRSELLFTKYII